MSDLHIVILAAGKGTRMKSALPKVLHRAGELPLIEHVFRAAGALSPASTTVIVGHQAEIVEQALAKRLGLRFALQQPQLGTGHALLQAEPMLAGAQGTVVLLSGDVPLLRPATLEALVRTHRERRAAATVLRVAAILPIGLACGAVNGLFVARLGMLPNLRADGHAAEVVRLTRLGVDAPEAEVQRSHVHAPDITRLATTPHRARRTEVRDAGPA